MTYLDTDDFTTVTDFEFNGWQTGISVHTFSCDSGNAYDLTQCREAIKHGDVLVIPDEQVIGVLDQAWPVAVTVEHGSLDRLVEGTALTALLDNHDHRTVARQRLFWGIAAATWLAREYGWESRAV